MFSLLAQLLAQVPDPSWIKEFLYDRTIYAVAALELFAIVTLFGLYVRERNLRIEDLRLVLPLADKMTDVGSELSGILQSVALKRRPRLPSPATSEKKTGS